MGGDAKRFGRNFASAAVAQFVTQVLTLLASVLIARRLDVSAYGVFVFGFAFPSWFLLLVSLGLDEVLATEVAADRAKAPRYLTTIWLLRLPLAGVAFAALWIATRALVADPFAEAITLVLGASSIVTTLATTFTSLFRAFERFESAALVTIAERTVTVGSAVLLLLLGFGLVEVSLAFLGGSFVLLVLSAALARRKLVWFAGRADKATFVHILRVATPFALFNAVSTFAYSSGLVLLALIQGPEPAGLFNASLALLFAMFSFLSIVSLTTLPMMSRLNRESRERIAAAIHRLQKLSLVIGVPLAFGGWFFAGPIVTTVYGPAFASSQDAFRILVLSFGVETATMGIGPALAATGHAKAKLYIASGATAIVISLSLIFIPRYGILGAASAFLASRVFGAVLGGWVIRKYVGPFGIGDTIVKTVSAASAMLLVLAALPGLSLWTGVLLGALVYFPALWAIGGTSREDRIVVREAIRGALFR